MRDMSAREHTECNCRDQHIRARTPFVPTLHKLRKFTVFCSCFAAIFCLAFCPFWII